MTFVTYESLFAFVSMLTAVITLAILLAGKK